MLKTATVVAKADESISAPKIDGYRFLAWYSCTSVGWVGTAYVENPTAEKTRTWFVASRYGESGGTVHCRALYMLE